jgi:hypothetical protein
MSQSNKISDQSEIIHEFFTLDGSFISIIKNHTVSIGESTIAVPKWILYFLGGFIVYLVIILAAAIIIINQAPRAALHMEDCQGRSCQSGFNLKCINNKCTCLSHQYFLVGCHQKKTYSDKCNQLFECDESKKLKCHNGFCQCTQNKYWNENSGFCIDRKTYGEICKYDNCLSKTQMLKCIDGICHCESTRFWTNKTCYLKRNQGQKCYDNKECDDTQSLFCRNGFCNCDSIWEYYDTNTRQCQLYLNESEACDTTKRCLGELHCLNGECSCDSFYYFEKHNFTCIAQVSVNESCLEDIQCKFDLGLSCQSNKCICDAYEQVWFNDTTGCVYYFNYSSVGCTRDSDCQPEKSLICNLNPSSNQCNCPLTSINAMCDCERVNGNELFWNGTSCVPAKTEFSTCSYSHECLNPMICNSTSNTCLCPFTQYYNSTTYSCDPKFFNSDNCSSNRTCREDLGLYCNSGICTCQTATQFWHSISLFCRNYYVYGEVGCSANSPCSPGLSLFCNTNPSNNNCTCPILSQANMCDCRRISGTEFYWDGLKCAAALPFNISCSVDYECQTITKGLECNATTKRCYCMDGWNHYGGRCYRIFPKDGHSFNRGNLFSKCAGRYSRSRMAVLSNNGIFDFVKSLDPDTNKVNFKDSYVGAYFNHNHQCPSTWGCVNHTIVWCDGWDRCWKRWEWLGGNTLFGWCTGSPVNTGAITCVRIDATSGTCLIDEPCTDNQNYICEYPV